ncbi:MAG: pyrroline-5-carboxylate reductase [Burkholderiaceae bacterium]
MKIGFIGGGNMAQALMGGLRARHDDARFVVVEPHGPTRDIVAHFMTHVALHDVPSADLATCDAVVVAVKPQQFREAVTPAARWLDGPLIVSIAAGIRTREIAHWLGADGSPRAIVRAMPNTPALIGEGITALYAMPTVDQRGRDLAQTMMAAVGQTLWVDTENALDAVTAVSGSGPAYVFSFIEALEQGGIELGLDAGDARRLAVATFVGASRLAAASEEPIAALRERVTSKGGTTHAALTHMTESGCQMAIVQAIHAAAKRSAELGDEFGK